MKFKVLNYKNKVLIPIYFFSRFVKHRKMISFTKRMVILIIIFDLLKMVTPSSFEHLKLKYPLTPVFLLLIGLLFICYLIIYLFKCFLEKDLLISVSHDSFKIWKGEKLIKAIFFTSVQESELDDFDIFIYYAEYKIG